jgi:hypothetical protein
MPVPVRTSAGAENALVLTGLVLTGVVLRVLLTGVFKRKHGNVHTRMLAYTFSHTSAHVDV